MLFAVLQLFRYLFLMGVVIFGTMLLKKTKLAEKTRKIANAVLVIIAVAFFFIPYKEILTFRSPETAFSATVLGDELMMAEGEETVGYFFRDPRGTFSTVFYYEEDGRYRMCASEDRKTYMTTQQNDVYVDLYRIGETDDCYILIRGYVPALMISAKFGNTFETKSFRTSEGLLYYSLARISCKYDRDLNLYVNGAHIPLNLQGYLNNTN